MDQKQVYLSLVFNYFLGGFIPKDLYCFLNSYTYLYLSTCNPLIKGDISILQNFFCLLDVCKF